MSVTRTIAFQSLMVVALLAILEAAARVAHTVQLNLAREPEWYVLSSDLGWTRRPNFDGLDDCRQHRAFGRDGLLASDIARLEEGGNEKFRALFLGGSITYGYCLEADETFVEFANRSLPDTVSINLGVNGYSSYQGYRALQKYGDLLDPDIVFISFGYNDRRLVLDPALADGEDVFRRLKSAAFFWGMSEFSYLFRAAQVVGEWLFPARPGASGYLEVARVDELKPRVDAENYRRNLVGMVEWARLRGIAVALILMGDNPDQTYLLREGSRALAAADYDTAIEKLSAALEEDDDETYSFLARLQLSKAYEGAKLTDKAQEVLYAHDVVAGIHGGYPIVPDVEYHRIVRDVGARYGLPIVDAAGALSESAAVFFDCCHFDSRGHEIIGRLVVDAIEAAKASSTAEGRKRRRRNSEQH